MELPTPQAQIPRSDRGEVRDGFARCCVETRKSGDGHSNMGRPWPIFHMVDWWHVIVAPTTKVSGTPGPAGEARFRIDWTGHMFTDGHYWNSPWAGVK